MRLRHYALAGGRLPESGQRLRPESGRHRRPESFRRRLPVHDVADAKTILAVERPTI